MPYINIIYPWVCTDGFIPMIWVLESSPSCLPSSHRSSLRLEIHPFRPSTGRVPGWEVPRKPNWAPMICDVVDLGFAVYTYIGWNSDCLQKLPSSKKQQPRSSIQKKYAFFRTTRSVEMNFLISNRSCHVQVRTGVHNCVHSTATQGCSWRRPRCNNFGILAAGAV